MAVERRVGPNQHRAGRVSTAQTSDHGQGVGDHSGGAPRRSAGTFPEPLTDDHRGRGSRRYCRQQCVQPADPGIAEPGALLLMPVNQNDRVVDIDQRPVIETGGDGTVLGEAGQEPGRDGVQPADVPEGERALERPQRRWCVATGEQFPHLAVAQQRHVIEAVRAGSHPANQRRDLQPGVGALVRRTVNHCCASARRPASSASFITGTSPADDTRFGSSNNADTTRRV